MAEGSDTKSQLQDRGECAGQREKPFDWSWEMKLKALSLFAGAGGLDIGVDGAGFKTICSIELDPHCVSTLRRNARGKTVWQVEVRALDPTGVASALNIWGGSTIWVVQDTLMDYIDLQTGLRLAEPRSHDWKTDEVNVVSANIVVIVTCLLACKFSQELAVLLSMKRQRQEDRTEFG